MKNICILVPSYNSSSTIEGTLKSILEQGSSLSQHIAFLMLSDDGSKDDTIAKAERLWNHPDVPILVKKAEKNQGEYKNVNSAIAAMPAHIEWVLIMHADNEALPGWIDLLARETVKAQPDIATVCGSWHFVVDGMLVDSGDKKGADYTEVIPSSDASIRNTLFKGCWWHNSTCAMRVKAWTSVGGHPQDTPIEKPLEILGLASSDPDSSLKMRIKGDWDVLLRLLQSGYSVVYIGTPLIRYMELSSSVSAGSFAWHGDLIETLQVIRRHQSCLSVADLIKLHVRAWITLTRRFIGSLLKLHWRRAGFAIWALPFVFASFLASSIQHLANVERRLKKVNNAIFPES